MSLRRCSTAVLAAGLLAATAHADEGMWMPTQLPDLADALAEAGFRGDAAALADVTAPPLSAVVRIGGGTGAFVSPEGLLLTNHHVAYGVIQYNSGEGEDFINDGFIARGRDDERASNPDFRVRVTVGFDKVTGQVLADARGLIGREYFDAVETASKRLVAECERTGEVRCSIADMHYGSDFYLVRQLELRDVRLVYAPPRAIGNYGDEIDNFMWPRHSGDFTLLRAYVGADGKPADYSPDNVPYAPPAHLQIAREGLHEGDFAMLAGYPGRTFRNRTAAEFKAQVESVLPQRVALYDALIEVLEAAGVDDADVRTRYASQLQSLKNNRKRAAGELEGLLRSDAVRLRSEDEAAMLAATGEQDASDIAALQRVLAHAEAAASGQQLLALMASQTQLLRSAMLLERLRIESAKPEDAARESGYQQRDHALIEGVLRQAQRRYAPDVEKALLTVLVSRYQALPDAQRLPALDAVFGRTPQSLAAALDAAYAQTGLDAENARLARFEDARAGRALATDPLLTLAARLVDAQIQADDARKVLEGEQLRLRPAYMRALAAWRSAQGRAIYPDANSTLRVSYGRVEALKPKDAVVYPPLTSVAGIVEKNTGQVPFDAPQPLLDAITRGDFAGTADAGLGSQPVNFMTNLDTTGGNSGSPVLDARGQLVGLNFDSNWESVSASWWFDPRFKRAIHVDMRYMRWLMDKVYPAPALLEEMGLGAP